MLKDEIVELLKQGKTATQIAKELNTSESYVCIVSRDTDTVRKRPVTKASLIHKYAKEGRSPKEIANLVGCAVKYVYDVRDSVKLTQDKVKDVVIQCLELQASGLTLNQVSKILKVSPPAITHHKTNSKQLILKMQEDFQLCESDPLHEQIYKCLCVGFKRAEICEKLNITSKQYSQIRDKNNLVRRQVKRVDEDTLSSVNKLVESDTPVWKACQMLGVSIGVYSNWRRSKTQLVNSNL